MGECVSVYLESVNITFGFFKIFHFSLCLYSMVFTWRFPFYFPGDLRERLGKFVTLHSSNSSIACFHVVLNISWPFIWLTFHLAVHSPGNLGYEPLCYFILFIAISLCSIIAHYTFSISIISYCLCLSAQDLPNLFWFSEIKWLDCPAHDLPFYVFWKMSVNLGPKYPSWRRHYCSVNSFPSLRYKRISSLVQKFLTPFSC